MVGLHQLNVAGTNWDALWTATTKTLAGDTITRQAATSTFTGHGREGEWDDQSRVICRTAPISVVEGSMIVDFTNAPGGWECGLTRPQTFATHISSEQITRFDGGGPNSHQCDYVVRYWDVDGAGTKKISIFQMMGDVGSRADFDQDAPNGDSKMVEVAYFGNTGGGRPAAQIDETDLFAAGKKYNFLIFEIKGEGIEITLGDKGDFSGSNQILATTFTTCSLIHI